MIDLHAHILPGLDDGAKTLEESLQMCWMSYKDGVRTMVATPHTLNGLYQNDRSIILTKVEELNEALIQCGMANGEWGIKNSKTEMESPPMNSEIRIPKSEFRILPGADVHFSEEILLQLDQERVTTIGDGGKFLFVEFPSYGIPYRAEEVLFQLMARGIIPVISHPERNREIGQRPQRYYEMIRMGCLGQVTAMSLTGEFGHGVRRLVEILVKKRLIHFIASDTHSVDRRPPILSEGLRAAEKILGKEETQRMVVEYPRSILEGRRPDVPEPMPL